MIKNLLAGAGLMSLLNYAPVKAQPTIECLEDSVTGYYGNYIPFRLRLDNEGSSVDVRGYTPLRNANGVEWQETMGNTPVPSRHDTVIFFWNSRKANHLKDSLLYIAENSRGNKDSVLIPYTLSIKDTLPVSIRRETLENIIPKKETARYDLKGKSIDPNNLENRMYLIKVGDRFKQKLHLK